MSVVIAVVVTVAMAVAVVVVVMEYADLGVDVGGGHRRVWSVMAVAVMQITVCSLL